MLFFSLTMPPFSFLRGTALEALLGGSRGSPARGYGGPLSGCHLDEAVCVVFLATLPRLRRDEAFPR